MPYYAQEDNQCGPATLAMVLGHRGLEQTPEQLAPGLFIPQKAGTLAIELLAQTRRQGFLAYPLAPDVDDLLTEIDAGNPVLVMQNLGFDWYPRWHFAVAFGHDRQRGQLILRSGPNATYAVPLTLFERTWRRADYWAMVAMPAGQLPATAEPLTMALATNALEQTGQREAAARSYQAMLERWPDNSLALFGLGNIRYLQGQLHQARRLLGERATRYPQTAETWNNLAYVERDLQCPANARSAVQCALSLAPDRRDFAATLSEMPEGVNSGSSCPALPLCPPVNDTAPSIGAAP